MRGLGRDARWMGRPGTSGLTRLRLLLPIVGVMCLASVAVSGFSIVVQVISAPSAAAATPTGQGIVSAAASQSNVTTYCWGGGGPSGPTHGQGNGGDEADDCGNQSTVGYDCAGLVIYAVYVASGGTITLPRPSQTQGADYAQYGGTLISNQSDLEPGDIVFLGGGSMAAATHEGVYAGGGLMWDSDTAYSWNGGSYPNGVYERSLSNEEAGLSFDGAVRFWSSAGGGGGGGTPPPSISSFTATPAMADETGGPVNLTADASNSTSYTFSSLETTDVQNLGTVSSSSGSATDTVTLPPVVSEVPETLTFMVTASGSGGSAVDTAYLSLSQSDTEALDSSTIRTADFCRQVGDGPDNVQSALACNMFNGTGFGSQVTSALTDWGYTGTGVWLPNKSGADYCREVGAGPNNVASYVACNTFNGTSFGTTIDSALTDWGVSGSAVWVPTTTGADFCRQVGVGPDNVASQLACNAFNGTTFGPQVDSSLTDWGYTGTGVWVPSKKGADYCREVGAGPNNVASYVACNTFNGTKFGSQITSALTDWGVTGGAVWVPTATGADFCRQVGVGPDNVASQLACNTFNGTSFGSQVTSALTDWGYTGTGVWVPTKTGAEADYCRESAPDPTMSPAMSPATPSTAPASAPRSPPL